MQVKYFLGEACKNTFLLFDQIGSTPDDLYFEEAHLALLQEDRDDALILTLEKKETTALYIKMHVLGRDKKFGEFCGNGARSVAAYLFSNYPEYEEFFIVTKRGTFPLYSLGNGIYSAHLPLVEFPQSKVKSLSYGEILEPHLAIQKSFSDEDLFSMGSHLNQQEDLFPGGININAWTILSENMIAVKTYERGVQGLTKSCGTGSSVCAALYLQGKGKVFVKTPGGILLIRIQERHVELIGRAK